MEIALFFLSMIPNGLIIRKNYIGVGMNFIFVIISKMKDGGSDVIIEEETRAIWT
jgi:hypothetical protein